MVDDRILLSYAQHVGVALAERGLILASAESCTGGWIGQVVTAVAGSSAWYDRGFITYSNHAKQQMLGVQAATLTQYGAVSEQTAQEMATGAIKMSDAQVAVAVTGIAGPAGGSQEKPVGMVCFAWASKQELAGSETHFFSGDREAIRRQAVGTALLGIIHLLDVMPPSLV
ncbi:CinA family protein [Nitrosomonas sp. Nm58]|uniref:CinA family protein n=1 Tax=Nitrosomonas sp. Nm58 TaxID=200126 RepID=UPI00089A3D88|nr:nicotinamide-nucleotide amidohydrolase family protein [Nitrosomonas sp. Nm58]SDY04860.1 nicotinamide-nucleotide amidase [Nitrosomonas sp. Nm58]